MKIRCFIRPVFLPVGMLCMVLLLLTTVGWSQEKPLLTADKYAQWESLGFQTLLSPDGKWLVYAVNKDSSEMRIGNLKNKSEQRVLFGSGARFSENSNWLAYSVGFSDKEKERLKKENKPVQNTLQIQNTVSGDTVSMTAVSTFSYSPDNNFLAVMGYPEKDSKVSLLRILNLKDKSVVSFGGVSEYGWAGKGALLAFITGSEQSETFNLQLYDAATGKIQVLKTASTKIAGIKWREKSADLLVTNAVKDSAFKDETNKILVWKELDGKVSRYFELDPYQIEILGKNASVSSGSGLRWNRDGSMIFFGMQPRKAAKDKPEYEIQLPKDVDYSDVQVWYSEDFRIIPEQRSSANRDRNKSYTAVWRLHSGQATKVGTDLNEEVTFIGNGDMAVVTDGKAYKELNMFDEPGASLWRDWYLVNTKTGERKLIVKGVKYFMKASPSGRYLLWFKDKDYWSYDTKTGTAANITGNLKANFDDQLDDHPGAPRPNGIAEWLTTEEAVLLVSQYDVWKISPDGKKAVSLTNGVKDSIVYRIARTGGGASSGFFRMNDGDDKGIDPGQPIYFSMNGEWTKNSGYAMLSPGGGLSTLIYEPFRISRLQRADSAGVFSYVKEDFDVSPNLFVSNGSNLTKATQVSSINAFQKDFAWGHSELINYLRDKTGERLQGVLLYPAGYDASKKYPMIVYQYERMSQQLHNYTVPSQESPYNLTVWTQNGYFVLLPDITYEAGDPGLSALRCVVPAVKAVISMGVINEKKIGLVGHSFGGYQALFIPTQTDLFAAVVEGAGISSLMDFPGQIHWNGGTPEWSHYETGQFRMGVPPWENMEIYMRNSPLNYIQNLNTPMLMFTGSNDGTVDWHQAIHFYNYARRAGKKDVVMLVYPGQNHSPGTKSSKIDYHIRILQWFGHWLKDEPAKKWMKGVSYLEYEDQLKDKKVKIPEAFHKVESGRQ